MMFYETLRETRAFSGHDGEDALDRDILDAVSTCNGQDDDAMERYLSTLNL